MYINNNNSTNFQGIKYQYHDVVNTWFNHRLKQNGNRALTKMTKIIEKQRNNPYHVILDYCGNDKTVKEFTRVNGKEFVKRPFESIISLIERSAKYADKLNKTSSEKLVELEGIKDFHITA